METLAETVTYKLKKINDFVYLFIEVWLIYSVLVWTVQQSDSVIHNSFLKYSFPLWFIIGS